MNKLNLKYSQKQKQTNKHLSEKQNWDRMSKIQPKNKENKFLRERERERGKKKKGERMPKIQLKNKRKKRLRGGGGEEDQ